MLDEHSNALTIMGVDPGSITTGYGIIRLQQQRIYYLASGCIRLKEISHAERLWHLFQSLSELAVQYKPSDAAIEQVFMHKNVSSALKLGQARGAALCALQGGGARVSEYLPRVVKQAVVGYGNAEKTQVQQMVVALLSLSGVPQADAADALAIAICHAHHLIRGINDSKARRKTA